MIEIGRIKLLKVFQFYTQKELFAWLADLTIENSTIKEYGVEENNTFTDKDISEGKFYGSKEKTSEEKSVFHRQSFLADDYRAYSRRSFTQGNGYGQKGTLIELIYTLRDFHDIYQFDTAKELFAWLAE